MVDLSKSSALHGPTYIIWQVTTLVLAALVDIGVVAFGPPDTVGWLTYAGLGFLTVHTVTACLLYARLTPRWRILVPVLSLCALAVIGAEVLPVVPMATMIGAIPLLWLVFEFGRRGLVVALISLAVVLPMVLQLDIVVAGSGPEWLQFLPIPLSAVGLLVGSHQIAITLARRERQLVAQARALGTTLKDSEDQRLLLETLLEAVDAVVVAYDDDGVLIWDNPAARSLVGRAGIETDGQVSGELHIYAEDQVTPLSIDEIPLARAHRGEEFDADLAWFGPPGDQLAYLLTSRQICRNDSERYGYVIAGLEVTDLLDAIRIREEFLTTVSHELRTPLTSIMGYHELLADEIDPTDQALLNMLGVAQRNAQVLLNRVGQLLQASGSAEVIKIERHHLDFETLTEAVLAKHHSAAQTLGVCLVHRVEAGLTGAVDAHNFEQVVDNLVSNALKHTPAGGKVTVCLARRNAAIVLEVTDTGHGMSAVEQRRAFDRFYRTPKANTLAMQGLGVGLSVVKAVVEAHRGEITLDSTLGVGTTVTVTVPDVDPDTHPDDEVDAAP